MSQHEIPARVLAHGITPNGTVEPIPAPELDDLANRLLTANEFLWLTDDIGWIKVWRTPSLTYAFFADVDGFVQGQYSHDGGQVDDGAVLRTYVAGTWISISTGSHRLPYWRPQFQCGPVAQSEFHLLAFPQTAAPSGPVFRLDQDVTDHSVAQTVRAQLDARNPLDANGKREPLQWLAGALSIVIASTQKSIKHPMVALGAGNSQIVAAVAGKRIKVFAISMEGTGNPTLQLTDGVGGPPLTPPFVLAAVRSAPPMMVSLPSYLWATSAGTALGATVVGGSASLAFSYWDDDAT